MNRSPLCLRASVAISLLVGLLLGLAAAGSLPRYQLQVAHAGESVLLLRLDRWTGGVKMHGIGGTVDIFTPQK